MGINDQLGAKAQTSVSGIRFFSGATQNLNAQIDPLIEYFDKEIAPIFKEQTSLDLIQIKITDKLVFPTLVTVAVSSDGKPQQAVVTYFSGANMSATKTVDEYLSELQEITSNPKMKGASADILLQDNINNDKVIEIIVNEVNNRLNNNDAVSICAFFTMAKKEELDASTLTASASRIADSLLMALCVESDLGNDVSMKSISGADWSVVYDVLTDSKQQTVSDCFGHYYGRHLSVTSKGTVTTNTFALGVAEKQQTLVTSKVNAVVDFRFDAVSEQNRMNGVVDTRVVAVPELIITKYESDRPSLSSFFLSLANTVQLLSNKNFSYAAHLSSMEQNDPVTNLNFILNIEGNENGLGKLPKAKDMSSDDVIKFLNQNLVNETIVSYKIDPTNSESYFNYILLGAAGGAGTTSAKYFNNLLLGAVNRLIGADINFDGPIFVGSPVKYPIGTFANKSGVNSFDTVNINEFIQLINGVNAPDIIYSLDSTNTNPNACININDRTYDSFVCILNALSEAGYKHGTLTGIGQKLTFNPEFISALIAAINSTGFTPLVTGPSVQADVVSRTINSGALNLGTNGRFNASSMGGLRSFVTGGMTGFRR